MTAALGQPGEARPAASLRRAALGVFGIRIAGAALAYAGQVLLARLMGRAEYGVYATVWVWIAILGHGSLWGLGQAAWRFVPLHRAQGRADLVRGFLSLGAVLVLAGSALSVALAGAVLRHLAPTLDPALASALLLALLVLPVFSAQDYLEGVARGFHWTGLAVAPPYILRQGLIIAAMIGAVALGAPAEPAVAVACTFAATLASLLVQAAILLHRLRQVLPVARPAYLPRTWLRTSLPIAFVEFGVLGLCFVDVVVLGFLLPAEAVGVYFAATRIQQFAVFVTYAASAATAPRFAEAQARGDRAALARLVTGTARLATLATASVALGIWVVAPLLLALFGPGFEASREVLAILLMGTVVQAAFGPAEDLLTMSGAERAGALVSTAALGIAVVLLLALVPLYGITGAALAMAATASLRGLALALAARLRLGLATHVLGRGVP